MRDVYVISSCRTAVGTFGGSLPAFLAAFTKRKKLSETELAEIRDMIHRMGGQ